MIIGCGGQGAKADQLGSGNEYKIISFAHAFKVHKNTDEIIFVDKNLEKAQEASETWGCVYSGTIKDAFDDYKPYMPHIAVVSTNDEQHYEILKQLANYPLKLVICEKPLCTDLQQAQEIVELYKQKNIPLMVDNTRNFIPELRSLTKEHGKAISGYALFNRGLLHSATHIFGFFRMLRCDNYKIRELDKLDFRVWILSITFEDGFIWSEERITNDMPVPDIYSNHMWYIVENAYNFLEGKEPLFYTGEEASKDIEECYKLMGAN